MNEAYIKVKKRRTEKEKSNLSNSLSNQRVKIFKDFEQMFQEDGAILNCIYKELRTKHLTKEEREKIYTYVKFKLPPLHKLRDRFIVPKQAHNSTCTHGKEVE